MMMRFQRSDFSVQIATFSDRGFQGDGFQAAGRGPISECGAQGDVSGNLETS
jgi:hypothetical protein